MRVSNSYHLLVQPYKMPTALPSENQQSAKPVHEKGVCIKSLVICLSSSWITFSFLSGKIWTSAQNPSQHRDGLWWKHGYKCSLSAEAAQATFSPRQCTWVLGKGYFEPLYRSTAKHSTLTITVLFLTGNSLFYVRFLI